MNPLGTGGVAKTLMVDLAIRYGFEVLGAFVILGVGFVIARWLGDLAERRMARSGVEVPIRKLGVRVLKLVVLLFALVVALDKFGFQIAPLVAGIGEVTDVAIKIRLQPWVGAADAGNVEPRLYEELIEAFRKRGITTPLPRHEVRLIDGAVAR